MSVLQRSYEAKPRKVEILIALPKSGLSSERALSGLRDEVAALLGAASTRAPLVAGGWTVSVRFGVLLGMWPITSGEIEDRRDEMARSSGKSSRVSCT
jgi:hypothetical protein